MAVWALIGFMGCGKSSIGRLVASFCGLGGSPLREFPAAAAGRKMAENLPGAMESAAAGRKTAENLPGSLESAAAGRKTAENLPGAMAFIDLDAEIEVREGRSIPEIFAAAGEAGFRAIERETLASLLAAGIPPSGVRFAHPTTPLGRSPRYRTAGVTSLSGGSQPPIDILLSLGGGTLTDEGSRELVKKNCKCIYLRATLETLAANLREVGTEGRPMLAGANPDAPADAPDSLESRISAMMAIRGLIYEKAADIILDIDGLDYSDVAQQILNSFSL